VLVYLVIDRLCARVCRYNVLVYLVIDRLCAGVCRYNVLVYLVIDRLCARVCRYNVLVYLVIDCLRARVCRYNVLVYLVIDCLCARVCRYNVLVYLVIDCLCARVCRYNVLVYLVTFVLSWLVFAVLWWAMQRWHGGGDDGPHAACVDGVDSFTTALLFSIETQHTIGYGSRAVTDRCTGAVALLMVQSVFGAVTQCIVTGIIFAKVAHRRPPAGQRLGGQRRAGQLPLDAAGEGAQNSLTHTHTRLTAVFSGLPG